MSTYMLIDSKAIVSVDLWLASRFLTSSKVFSLCRIWSQSRALSRPSFKCVVQASSISRISWHIIVQQSNGFLRGSSLATSDERWAYSRIDASTVAKELRSVRISLTVFRWLLKLEIASYSDLLVSWAKMTKVRIPDVSPITSAMRTSQ